MRRRVGATLAVALVEGSCPAPLGRWATVKVAPTLGNEKTAARIGGGWGYCRPMKKLTPVKMVSRVQLKLRQVMYQSEGSAVSAFSTRKQMLR